MSPSVEETILTGRTPQGGANAAGIDAQSYSQKITFDLYNRVVLPADGFVFWVKSTLLSPGALLNTSALNGSAFNETDIIEGVAASLIAQGSLHYATAASQAEAANMSTNRVVFTSLVPVQDLNAVGPGSLYIATFDRPPAFEGRPEPASTTPIRFAFSGRGSYYEQANEWHYYGFAVYPTMASQVVDDPRLLTTRSLIVSNSLPSWLAFNFYDPVYPVNVPRPGIMLYPSFLVPDNLNPPYGSIHIEPGGTEGVAARGGYSGNTSTSQLASDKVTLTLYGCDNDTAITLRDSLIDYATDTMRFGVTNIPVPMDEKEGQAELGSLAQKKKIQFDVSYIQSAQRDIARQLITECVPLVIPQTGV